MNVVLTASRIIVVALAIAGIYQAKGWRGIVPLHSTRADVERLIGRPNFKYGLYDFEGERVSIRYSAEPCTEGWNVPRGTVIQVSVAPKMEQRLSDLPIDLSKYERIKDLDVQVHTHYWNKEEGITYDVFEGGGEDNGKILNIDYGPAAKDKDLRCKE